MEQKTKCPCPGCGALYFSGPGSICNTPHLYVGESCACEQHTCVMDWETGKKDIRKHLAPEVVARWKRTNAAKMILESFQKTHPCRENACTITKLDEAIHWLDARTKAREKRVVEGTSAT